MKSRHVLQSFIIGSSIISTIITFSYMGFYFRKENRPSSIPFELFSIGIPIIFGLFNIINVYLQRKYKTENIAFFVGATMGLLFSIIGMFILNIPTKIFNLVHLIEFFLYGLIFQFGIQYFNKYFNLITSNYSSIINHPSSF
jgi:hypothetical protein